MYTSIPRTDLHFGNSINHGWLHQELLKNRDLGNCIIAECLILDQGLSPTCIASETYLINYILNSIVWFHPGIHKTEKPVVMTRLLMNTLESAVQFSLDSTNGKVGKYFVFLDCDGFRLGSLPPLSDVKKTFRFMQDHMPDRLEEIYLFNLSTAAQLFLNMVTSVLSKEVSSFLE